MLIEWPRGAAEPAKYWLANLPAATPLKELVWTAKLRWRIERDFHHYATLCIAAYGFLAAERCAFSPLAIAAAIASARRTTSGRAAPRLRPQRHEPTSIASLRIILARLLLRALPHCPYCHRSPANPDAPFL